MDNAKVLDILLVEDDPADVELTMEALNDSKLRTNMHVVENGEEAMAFLRCQGRYTNSPRPDLILLDLNMPKKDGREVLAEVKADESLRHIPVVILTTSSAEEDVLRSYNLGANCYVTKPVGLEEFMKVVDAIDGFWFTVVRLPAKVRHG